MAKHRGIMALIGALAGGSLYLVALVIDANWLVGRPALAAALAAGVFFGGLLITAGPLSLIRAAMGALAIAAVVAALVTFASLRFGVPDNVAGSILTMVSVLILMWLPWPFVIAHAGQGWRDYPSLFSEAWGIVVRTSMALIFTGIVWAVIFLSKALLGLVGVDVIGALLDQPYMPWLITGTVLGLALAVVNELADVLSPNLVLRLLRLLLPVVLVVMVIFLVALPIRGFAMIFGEVSSAMVLLAMAGAAVMLVTSALDQKDVLAAHSAVMVQSARLMAAIVILPAGLAAWALWMRVNDHGWTPVRLLAATVVVLVVLYGLLYLLAVLRGHWWMERIRQANIWMAVAMMAVAILWLTVLNPEGISARSQLVRIADGRTPVQDMELDEFNDWGLAGATALGRLKELAKTNQPLADRLAGVNAPPFVQDPAVLQKALAAAMPMQPDTDVARALRDRILTAVPVEDLQGWQTQCDAHLPHGSPGCVLVVADFLPASPGDEAMLVSRDSDGYLSMEGFAFDGATIMRHPITAYDGALPGYEDGVALIDGLQKTQPPVSAVPLNQITVRGLPGLAFAP